MSRITKETKELVKSLLKCGLVGYEVAEKAGVSIATVNKCRKELEESGFDIWHIAGRLSMSV